MTHYVSAKAATLTALAALVLASSCVGATAETDSVTGLPLYPLAGTPDSTMNATICRSKTRINNYDILPGTDAAALAWFASNLHGFTHTHGIAQGSRQDLFIKKDGTVVVVATATDDGIHLYGVSYTRFTPPLNASQQIQYGKLSTSC